MSDFAAGLMTGIGLVIVLMLIIAVAEFVMEYYIEVHNNKED